MSFEDKHEQCPNQAWHAVAVFGMEWLGFWDATKLRGCHEGGKGRRWTEPRVTCLGTGRSGPLGMGRNMQDSVVQKHSNRYDRLAKGAYLGPYQLGPEKHTDGLGLPSPRCGLERGGERGTERLLSVPMFLRRQLRMLCGFMRGTGAGLLSQRRVALGGHARQGRR
jgi:hypothetical protein